MADFQWVSLPQPVGLTKAWCLKPKRCALQFFFFFGLFFWFFFFLSLFLEYAFRDKTLLPEVWGLALAPLPPQRRP